MKFFTTIMVCFVVMSAGGSVFANMFIGSGKCSDIGSSPRCVTTYCKAEFNHKVRQCQNNPDGDWNIDENNWNGIQCESSALSGYPPASGVTCDGMSPLSDPLTGQPITAPEGGGNAFVAATDKLYELFEGLRGVVYTLALIAFIGFAIASMLGKLDWKKVAMLGAGLFLLSIADAVVQYVAQPI